MHNGTNNVRKTDAHLQIIPIRQFIHHLTDKFFMSCPMNPNALIRNTWNYNLEAPTSVHKIQA